MMMGPMVNSRFIYTQKTLCTHVVVVLGGSKCNHRVPGVRAGEHVWRRAHGTTHGCRCWPVQNYRRRVMDAKLGYVDVPMGFSHLCIIRLPANPLKVPIPIIKINCFHRPSAINQNLVGPVSTVRVLSGCRRNGHISLIGYHHVLCTYIK